MAIVYPASYSCSDYLPIMPSSNGFAWETTTDYPSHYYMQPSYEQLEEPFEVCVHCSPHVSVNTYVARDHHHQTTDYFPPPCQLQLDPPSPASISPLNHLPYQEYGSYSDLSSSPETSPSCSSLDHCYSTSPSISYCSSPALPPLQDIHAETYVQLEKSINQGLENTTKKGMQEFLKCIRLRYCVSMVPFEVFCLDKVQIS